MRTAGSALEPSVERLYDHATWTPLVGHTFSLDRGEGGPVELELLQTACFDDRGQCFTLLFAAPEQAELDQRTHRLAHAELGAFPLFLVPVGPGADGHRRLEAVINRPER